jgi:hypothetical protein
MAAQKGYQYELNAAIALEPFDLVRKGFRPAGAGADKPDLMIKKPGEPRATGEHGCELKISPAASGGSLVLKYNGSEWYFDEPRRDEDEKIFIKGLAESSGALREINRKWKGIEPIKFSKSKPAGLDKKGIYKRELSQFDDVKGQIRAEAIEGYYNAKKTYYINVGTHGFYLLGPKNPMRLIGLKRFKDAATAGWRARVQNKGSGNYQFTFELTFSILASNRSKYNIAPLNNAKDIKINLQTLENTIAELFGT